MHERFKQWIVEKHEQMDPLSRQHFLSLLKLHPDQVLKIISSHLEGWGAVFIEQTGEMVVSYSNENDSEELLKVFQEHFATELAAIP